MSTIYEYELTTPIQHGNEIIKIVSLRSEITAADIQECGDLYDIIPETRAVRANNKAVGAYISALSGLPPSVVNKLSVYDFNTLKGQITIFFAPKSDQTLKTLSDS